MFLTKHALYFQHEIITYFVELIYRLVNHIVTYLHCSDQGLSYSFLKLRCLSNLQFLVLKAINILSKTCRKKLLISKVSLYSHTSVLTYSFIYFHSDLDLIILIQVALFQYIEIDVNFCNVCVFVFGYFWMAYRIFSLNIFALAVVQENSTTCI